MSQQQRHTQGNGTPELPQMSQEELFANLNASAERTLQSLQQAYDARAREGFEGDEEEQLLDMLRQAKALRDEVKRVTSEPQPPAG